MLVKNDRAFTRETLKYLVNYVPLKQMNNVSISYYFAKQNPEVINNMFSDTVFDVEDVLSVAEEQEDQDQYQDQDQHYDSREGGDDDDDDDPKGDSSSANMVGTTAPSSQSDIYSFTLFPENLLDRFKIEREEKKVTNVIRMRNNVGNI